MTRPRLDHADTLAALIAIHDPALACYEREYPFAAHLKRRFRADFAYPSARLLVEVDGGQYTPGGGRHATDRDRDKLNLAAMLGYRVLRFSPAQLDRDPIGCLATIRTALEASCQEDHNA